MRKYIFAIVLLSICLMAIRGFGITINVPADYGTIQNGINASNGGDTVLVAPGTYFENIDLNSKHIVLCSWYLTTGDTSHIAGTIIDGGSVGRVITINQGEDSTTVISGFTIQSGSSWYDLGYSAGGGILILESSPIISHCVIQNNTAPVEGGGVAIVGLSSAAKVMNCTIQNNVAMSSGGGLYMGDCSLDAEVSNSIITGNSITCTCNFSGGGGGANLFHRGKLVNCLITNNSAPNSLIGGGGVFCDWGDYYGTQGIFVTGCTISNNTASSWGAGVSNVINGGEFRNCIIWGNTDSSGNPSNYEGNAFVNCCTTPLPIDSVNIATDPAFVNPANNFRLLAGSPCINAGNNIFNDQTSDLDGNARISGSSIDMGAYEKPQSANVTVQIGSGPGLSDYLPIYSCYGYNYSQQIYYGSEITSGGGSAGSISKIRFYYSSGAPYFESWNDWTVYLGNTTKSSFAGTTDWVPIGSLTQVFSGLIPTPVDSTWLELTLPVPFSYSGQNLIVAIDENSNGWDCTAHWSAFTADSARGLIYFNDEINPDPASPPESNSLPEYSISQVQFDIETGLGTLEGTITEQPGCTLPFAGATISTGIFSTTANASGFYRLTLPSGTYFDITAHYGDVSQSISPIIIVAGDTTTQDFCLPPYLAPPVDLRAAVVGTNQNNVHLTWMAPGSLPDQWILWGDGNIYGYLGYSGPMVFNVASRWPVEDIAAYNGTYLKKIRFVVGEPTATYTLKVWKGVNASTLIHSQVVNNPFIYSLNEITLSSPILIDGTEEFWFGYEINQTTGYPAGLSAGPAIAGKGDMINNGSGWVSMKNGWNFDFNWAIQGFVSESPVMAQTQVTPMVQKTIAQPMAINQLKSSERPSIKLVEPTSSMLAIPGKSPMASRMQKQVETDLPASSAIFSGYNLYRNNVKIADNIPELFYDDLTLPKGGYNYEVAAQYDLGESARIGPVHVGIYTCFPPTELSVSNSTLTTTTAELSWTPSTSSSNLQWILEWGPKNFTPGNLGNILINTTPQYTLTGLNPGTEYDFYVSTYCSSTDTSARVKKTFRTHYLNCPAEAIPEQEACGGNSNNGCGTLSSATEPIACGETVCGTSWLQRSHRDTDWYSFILTETNDVTLSAKAEFYGLFAISDTACTSATFISAFSTSAGYNSWTTTQLAAGTYYVFAASNYGEQVTCDSLSRYWIKLTCNPCLTPTALNATSITSTTASLTWSSTATMWDIEWGPVGYVKGTGTTISGTGSNPYQLTGLSNGHAYSYYVRSICGVGDTSNWAGPHTFFLPCPATSLPFAEDFSLQTVGATPHCWQVLGVGGFTNWIVGDHNNAGGGMPELNFVPYQDYFNGTSYVVSPKINTNGQSSLELSFKQWFNIYNNTASCELLTTSDGGVSWHSVWSSSQTGGVGPASFFLTIATPDVGSSNFQFAFAVNGYSWDVWNWNVDDILLSGTGPAVNTSIQNVTVLSSENSCYNATETITVAGSGTTFVVENGGSATMIAGLKISYLPGTHVHSGGYMLGKIAPGGPWCGLAPTAPLVSAGTGDIETTPVLTKPNLRVYPNPTTGSFKLEITGEKYEQIRVEIYGMTGGIVLSETRSGAIVYDFSLSGRPAGIYFIKVVSGETIMSTKLVKTR